MCDNIEINKELFDVIMRLKRQSHGNIKLKDLNTNFTAIILKKTSKHAVKLKKLKSIKMLLINF